MKTIIILPIFLLLVLPVFAAYGSDGYGSGSYGIDSTNVTPPSPPSGGSGGIIKNITKPNATIIINVTLQNRTIIVNVTTPGRTVFRNITLPVDIPGIPFVVKYVINETLGEENIPLVYTVFSRTARKVSDAVQEEKIPELLREIAAQTKTHKYNIILLLLLVVFVQYALYAVAKRRH